MDSHEWRAKKLENTLPGPINLDQLVQVAKVYRDFIDANGEKYAEFLKLYETHRESPYDQVGNQVSVPTKADLVLAYEDDLVRHLENVQALVEKANRVLDTDKWPDSGGFEKRLEKLETITRDQHLRSTTLDLRTEELIEVYNDIISSFKKNAAVWNRKLEAYEMEERKFDQDEVR